MNLGMVIVKGDEKVIIFNKNHYDEYFIKANA